MGGLEWTDHGGGQGDCVRSGGVKTIPRYYIVRTPGQYQDTT